MVNSTRIALLGFGRIEHAAFDAFFRVASRRCPAYAQETDFRVADFVIVDATDQAACAAVREAGLVARTVALGQPALAGALLQLARPLNLMQVVRALDEVVSDTHAAEEDTVGEGLFVVTPEGDAPAASDEAGADAGPGRRRRGLHMEHILVVDDSEVALRFMATHLQRFGFQIHLAKSGEEALRRVAERRFEFVFLDVRMEGLDGFQTCKAIKRTDYPPGQARTHRGDGDLPGRPGGQAARHDGRRRRLSHQAAARGGTAEGGRRARGRAARLCRDGGLLDDEVARRGPRVRGTRCATARRGRGPRSGCSGRAS